MKSMSKLFCTAVLSFNLLFIGCATSGGSSAVNVCTTTTTLAGLVQSAAAASVVVESYHNSHLINDTQYAQAQQAYALFGQTMVTASNLLVLANDNGGSLSPANAQQLASVVIQLTAIAGEVAIIVSSSSHPMTVTAAGPVACVMSDAQIQSELAVPAWAV